MTDNITHTIPSLAEVAAATRAAHINAEMWVTRVDGGPIDEHVAAQGEFFDAGCHLDSIHADEISSELGVEDGDLTREQEERLWPVYRAALVSKVNELLAQEKG